MPTDNGVMEKVHFSEEKVTMLATLYGRVLDNRLDRPILGDPTAEASMRRIDCDFAKLGMGSDMAVFIAARARRIDDWAAEFLRENPSATVLHLGCGMDSRVFRLAPPPSVRWVDVDYPEVIALRRRIYSDRENYHTIGSSVTDFDWLDQVPGDQPTLIVAEGLFMYLTREDGEELLRRFIAKFPSGEMIFDALDRQAVRLQKLNPVVRRAGAEFHWGIDDPHELDRLGVTIVDASSSSHVFDVVGASRQFSRKAQSKRRLISLMPRLRGRSNIIRARF